jgi:hypothetical protein
MDIFVVFHAVFGHGLLVLLDTLLHIIKKAPSLERVNIIFTSCSTASEAILLTDTSPIHL